MPSDRKLQEALEDAIARIHEELGPAALETPEGRAHFGQRLQSLLREDPRLAHLANIQIEMGTPEELSLEAPAIQLLPQRSSRLLH